MEAGGLQYSNTLRFGERRGLALMSNVRPVDLLKGSLDVHHCLPVKPHLAARRNYQPPCCGAWPGTDLDHQIKLAQTHTQICSLAVLFGLHFVR